MLTLSIPAPPEQEHILLFRTDMRTRKAARGLRRLLAGLPLKQWTLDREDRVHVLRIVSAVLRPAEIIALLTRQGHQCAELT